MTARIKEIIEHFQLTPHPEGGFYRETYRSSAQIPEGVFADKFSGVRSCCTAIYFLLPAGHKSHLHRIKSDEIWHFYAGGGLCVVEISPAGQLQQTTLGADFSNGSTVQHVVKAGNWFGSFPLDDAEYCLVGCTVAPGFDFHDFEMAQYEEMIHQYPHHKAMLDFLVKK